MQHNKWAYYNDIDPKVCAWVRELIAAKLITDGEVDERSINEIQPHELRAFRRVHLFCGVAGWELALQLAGWPADKPVWTGSCPCQPFSCAGKGKGQSDERHLWPEMFRLIRECRPDTIFGEQVKAAIGFGWLDGISDDLEGIDYAVGSAVIGAFSVGAPHIRQRLYWVANAQGQGRPGMEPERAAGIIVGARVGGDSPNDNWGGLAHSEQPRLEGRPGHEHDRNEPGRDAAHAAGPVAQGCGARYCEHCCESYPESSWRWSDGKCPDCGLVNSHGSGSQSGQSTAEAARYGSAVESNGGLDRLDNSQRDGRRAGGDDNASHDGDQLDATCNNGFWSSFDLIPCRDGKVRRIPESGIFPLAYGVSSGVGPGSDPSLSEVQATPEGRVMRLKGYGNAIVPQVAAEFIRSVMEAT